MKNWENPHKMTQHVQMKKSLHQFHNISVAFRKKIFKEKLPQWQLFPVDTKKGCARLGQAWVTMICGCGRSLWSHHSDIVIRKRLPRSDVCNNIWIMSYKCWKKPKQNKCIEYFQTSQTVNELIIHKRAITHTACPGCAHHFGVTL